MHVTRSSKSLKKYKIMQKLMSDGMTPTTTLSGGSSPPTTLEKVGKYETLLPPVNIHVTKKHLFSSPEQKVQNFITH